MLGNPWGVRPQAVSLTLQRESSLIRNAGHGEQCKCLSQHEACHLWMGMMQGNPCNGPGHRLSAARDLPCAASFLVLKIFHFILQYAWVMPWFCSQWSSEQLYNWFNTRRMRSWILSIVNSLRQANSPPKYTLVSQNSFNPLNHV